MKKYILTILIMLSGFFVLVHASQTGIKLSKAQQMPAFSRLVQEYVARQGMKEAKIITSQSFDLSINNQYVGTLLTGRGMYPNEWGGDRSTCFVAFVRKSDQIDFLPTVGANEWEVPSCLEVIAVGALQAKNDKEAHRLVILHRAVTRHFDGVEPVILLWNTALKKLEYDIESYKKASDAGADTISKVRELLK